MQIHSNIEVLVAQIDAILPQTQCEKCGYAGCMPYAKAIAKGEADINQCPPGGDAGIRALVHLTHIAYKPLNAENGIEKPKALAVIDEASCIGCTLCIKACPVDAILGASKQMHTVIASECTGCELCLAPCPVDCITMQPVSNSNAIENLARGLIKTDLTQADLARKRYYFRLSRIEQEKLERTQKFAQRKLTAKTEDTSTIKNSLTNTANDLKKLALNAAIARAEILKSATKSAQFNINKMNNNDD